MSCCGFFKHSEPEPIGVPEPPKPAPAPAPAERTAAPAERTAAPEPPAPEPPKPHPQRTIGGTLLQQVSGHSNAFMKISESEIWKVRRPAIAPRPARVPFPFCRPPGPLPRPAPCTKLRADLLRSSRMRRSETCWRS